MPLVSQVYSASPSGSRNYSSYEWSSSVNIFIWCPPAASTVFLELGQNWHALRKALVL